MLLVGQQRQVRRVDELVEHERLDPLRQPVVRPWGSRRRGSSRVRGSRRARPRAAPPRTSAAPRSAPTSCPPPGSLDADRQQVVLEQLASQLGRRAHLGRPSASQPLNAAQMVHVVAHRHSARSTPEPARAPTAWRPPSTTAARAPRSAGSPRGRLRSADRRAAARCRATDRAPTTPPSHPAPGPSSITRSGRRSCDQIRHPVKHPRSASTRRRSSAVGCV